MFPIEEIVSPPPITIVDIGAMLLHGTPDPLARLSQAGLATIIGFEPQPDECRKLNALGIPRRQYLPYAVGDGRRRAFYVTNTGMTSSLLRPNLPLAALFQNLAGLMQVVATAEIDTYRLDDLPELRGRACDYLKIDTQGSEAEILSNATEILHGCLLVEAEVEFVPLYEGQPLFADVDSLLRSQGFMFHRFLGLHGRPYQPLLLNNDPNQPISQTLWSDAVYVRDVMALESLSPEQLLKLAALLHEIYSSVDLCHVLLSAYDRRQGTSLAARYLKRLFQP